MYRLSFRLLMISKCLNDQLSIMTTFVLDTYNVDRNFEKKDSKLIRNLTKYEE